MFVRRHNILNQPCQTKSGLDSWSAHHNYSRRHFIGCLPLNFHNKNLDTSPDRQTNLWKFYDKYAKEFRFQILCILHHRGIQLILTYSWARLAILVTGKGKGGMFLFLLFLHFHSCSSFFLVPFFHLLYSSRLSLFSPSLGDNTKWPTRVDMLLNPNTI